MPSRQPARRRRYTGELCSAGQPRAAVPTWPWAEFHVVSGETMTGSVEKSATVGEAGYFGKDVRSDVHVAIEPRDAGGLDIAMESRVAPYYGGSILAQARQVLEVLGVKHARVSI